MKSLSTLSSLLTLLVISTAASLSAAEPATKNKVLIDFTKQDVDVSGGIRTPIRKYEFSFESWQNKLVFLEGKGVLVPALSGKGGMGKNDRLNFGPSTSGEIQIAIGSRNESASFSVSMVDSDGTDVSWSFPLKDKPRGVPLTFPISLTQPDNVDKPGKKPGFDKDKIKSWQIKGNWQEPKIEIVIIRISAVAPAP